MLQTLRRARLVWPAIATAAAIALLVSLGTWQLHRLQWKEALLATLEKNIKADPVPLDAAPEGGWLIPGADEYRPVIARGRFRHDAERHLFMAEDGRRGWHIYTPLETADGRMVFVNRGFVPDEKKAPETRKEGQLSGEVEVVGLLRATGTKETFSPDPDTIKNVWYWRDLAGMAAYPGLLAPGKKLMPFFIDARAEPKNPGGLPEGGATRITITNRHLEYLLTWYGLAATVLVIFLVFAVQRAKGVDDVEG